MQQKWFKRVYIRDSYSKARAYLLKCSLLFQELYFPPNSAITRFNITLHDVNILKQTVPFKPDFEQIFENGTENSDFQYFLDGGGKNYPSIFIKMFLNKFNKNMHFMQVYPTIPSEISRLRFEEPRYPVFLGRFVRFEQLPAPLDTEYGIPSCTEDRFR